MKTLELPAPILALLSCALFTGSLSAAEWQLTFAVTEERIIGSPDGKAPPRNETRQFTQVVALGANCLVVQDDRKKTVYDFAGRRLTILELAPLTYNELSLYHLPSFFEHELFNRNAIGAGLRTAKIGQRGETFSRFANETALHVESRRGASDSPVPVIETTKQAEALEFRHQGAVAARFVPADTPLPAFYRHRFANYLAYACSIHPQIRRALVETGAVPREFTVKWDNTNTRTTATLRLVSSAAADTDSSILPAGAKPAAHADDPLFALLGRSEEAARDPARPDRTATIAFADNALAAGRPLDAMLALLEFGLQSGEQLTDEIRRHHEAFNRDPACQAYRQAYGQSDKATAEKNLAVNATIKREGLVKAHMLDLQRANLLERAGQPREAIEHFFKVLQANPYHAGALHDLGMVYARGFEPGKAWLCWDLARRLYPDHPMMSDVARMEQELIANLPDFF